MMRRQRVHLRLADAMGLERACEIVPPFDPEAPEPLGFDLDPGVVLSKRLQTDEAHEFA